jgi:hypothetical protein
VPPLERNQELIAESEIEGVSIIVTPAGAAAWRIAIKNDTEAQMSVLWDESSFVGSTGESGGRLIRGSTRKMDVAKAQPPTPLPGMSHINELVLVENLTNAEEGEARAAGQSYPRSLVEKIVELRERTQRMILGGHLRVTIQTSAGNKTWKGVVREVQKSPHR